MTEQTRTSTTTAIAETPEGSTPPSEPTSPVRTRRVRILSSISFACVALAGILLVLYAWNLPPFSSTIESTENALVRGQVTIIGPQLSGYVVDVPVHDFQFVKAGDLLVQLDDRIYKQRLAQAIAQLQQQQAALANNLQQRNSAEATIAQRQAAIGDAAAKRPKPRLTSAATRPWSAMVRCRAARWTWPAPARLPPSPAWPRPRPRWKSPARTAKR